MRSNKVLQRRSRAFVHIFSSFLSSSPLALLHFLFFPICLDKFPSEDRYLVVVFILVIYLVLGCVMDSLSMILLTIPIFFPIVSGLDYGLTPEEFAIWFGILVLIVVEVGLITPPVGMNLFVINSMAKDTPIAATYRGVMPFVTSDLVRTAILVLFPSITLGLMRLLY